MYKAKEWSRNPVARTGIRRRNRTKLSGLGAIAFWAFEIFSYGNSRRTSLVCTKELSSFQIGRLDGQWRGGDSGKSQRNLPGALSKAECEFSLPRLSLGVPVATVSHSCILLLTASDIPCPPPPGPLCHACPWGSLPFVFPAAMATTFSWVQPNHALLPAPAEHWLTTSPGLSS